MRDRRDPWKWPCCIGATVAMVLVTVFLLPQSWIAAFFSPLSLVERQERAQAPRWLAILPPPAVEMVADDVREPEPPILEPFRPELHLDPDWWSRGWVVRADPGPPVADAAAPPDSMAILLAALGLERDFMHRARPDSVLAARLFIMKVEDSFGFDELKPYLSAMTRSRAMADIHSRAADMYDNFLAQEIMTPD
jgi:hypothetical protein